MLIKNVLNLQERKCSGSLPADKCVRLGESFEQQCMTYLFTA